VNILFFLTPKSDVAYIYEDETLRQTVEKMEHRKFSCIPILNKEGKYTGTISEGDLLWGIKLLNISSTDLKEMENVSIMAIPLISRYMLMQIWKTCWTVPSIRTMFLSSMTRDPLSESSHVKKLSNIATKK